MGSELSHLQSIQLSRRDDGGFLTEEELKSRIGVMYDQKWVNENSTLTEEYSNSLSSSSSTITKTDNPKTDNPTINNRRMSKKIIRRIKIQAVIQEAIKRKIVKQSDVDFRNLVKVASLKKVSKL